MQSISVSALNENLPKKWEVEKPCGEGGQGLVFKGAVRGQVAAIKLFFDDGDFERVAREVAALTKLSCRNLVKVLDACTVRLEEKAYQVVAYEFLDGGDLRPLCKQDSPKVPESELARIGRDVATGLDALWGIRVVHRDVKPANILKTTDDRLVLVDLALARHLDESSLTRTGWTCGTPAYMSPEHEKAWKALTISTDVFSLGVTLFEIATKRLPPKEPQKVMAALMQHRQDLKGATADTIVAMLARTPYERLPVESVIEQFGKSGRSN